MKAVRIHSYGKADQLKVEEAPKPQIARDEVLVKIYDAGINPVDWKIRAGYLKSIMPKEFPLTMGQDIAGVVAEVGADVNEFKPGDEVFGFATGAYAEYAAAKASELAHKPRSVDFAAAAAIPTAGLMAWQIVIDTIQVSTGQSVLIHGAAGGVGSFAVQLAKWRAARVFATASPEDANYLKSLGVEQAVNYKTERFEDKVKDVDAVIDLVGGETLQRSYQVVKSGGWLVTTVAPVDENEAKERGIHGLLIFVKPNGSELGQIAQLVDQGILKPRVDKVLPLAEAKRAHELNESGQSHGKIVLQVA
ncbi:MAG TPA: NADP-dependent oxidoreductase [Terriglobales bacterium]|jgi:NADPH:quinone reductase-like Zn-dependent oxidoreductase|nr:NADP-dependent oxidoreductase [Terriglobales bacterium]